MYKLRRKLLSQNFLRNRELVKKLIRNSSLGKNDLVLEIGPGKGIITEELVKHAQHVIGVELDLELHQVLQQKFKYSKNLTLYLGDILTFPLPRLPYKVFANIPFAIEGKVIRKLIDDTHPPEDCYLVMMKDVAERLSGIHKDNLFSLSHKPFFEFSIFHRFNRFDFTPPPRVESAMLRFQKRKTSFIPLHEKQKYQTFIQKGFENGLPVYQNLKEMYGKKKVLWSLQSIGANKYLKPTYLSLEQWIQLFKSLT